jgi:hypothetical protein
VSTPEQLFDELLGRWTRGEPLQVDELLLQAGERSGELAPLVDAFLQRSPRREPTAEAIAFVRSLETPSLLRARQERRLKLDDLTAALIKNLGLPAKARAKVRRYYQDLELGHLDPAGVAASVWDALSALLGRDALSLALPRPAAPAAPTMFRAAPERLSAEVSVQLRSMEDSVSEPHKDETEPDEVDRLFGVLPSA